MDDGRGLRNPVYFRFILTVDNRTAERFARIDGRLAERVIRDAVGNTFHGATRGVQGVFAVHQHGGEDRAAHPHVHALLSPRFDDKSPVHLSPRAIQAVKQRWEREVLRGLERQERRLEHARKEHAPVAALTPFRVRDRASPQRELVPARRQRRRLGPVGVLFLRTKKARRAARLGGRWLDQLIRPERLKGSSQEPERAVRRTAFRLATGLMPKAIREALWALRGLRDLGLRQR
jgi:hypothetical protein